jgi:uncharacterized RDD family membrane protein YckC
MPNEQILRYLVDNKDKFPSEVLLQQLRESGYPEEDILAGAQMIYSGSGNVPTFMPLTIRYAGIGARFVAVLIDGIILQVGLALIKMPLFALLLAPSGTLAAGSKMVGIATYVLSIAVSWTYMVTFLHFKGATPGKMIFGIKVVSVDGNRATFGQIVLRETIGKFLSGVILGIGYLMAIWDDRKRTLHDRMAATVVIRTR